MVDDHLYFRPRVARPPASAGSPVRPTLLDGPVDRMAHRMFDADGKWIVRIHSQVQRFARLQHRIAVRIHRCMSPRAKSWLRCWK